MLIFVSFLSAATAAAERGKRETEKAEAKRGGE